MAFLRSLLFAVVAAMLLLYSASAAAQTQPTPPEHYALDARGVDLVRGDFTYVATDLVIGEPGNGGIVHARVYANGGWRDTLSGTIAVSGSTYTVSLGPISEVFTLSGSTFTPVSNNGSTLTRSGTTFTFTAANGAVATYSTIWSGSTWLYQANGAALMTHRQPNGETLTYHWDGITYCASIQESPRDPCTLYQNAVRLEAVTSNRGYMIKFIYATEEEPTAMDMSWLHRVEAIGINLAVDYCNPSANSCPGLTQDWPRVTYELGAFGVSILSVTDQSGRITRYSYAGTHLSGVRLPASSTDDIVVTRGTLNRVASVTMAGATWTYGYADSGATRTTTITNPNSTTVVATSNLTIGRLSAYQNELSQTTSYQYDGQRRLTRATHPEGNYTQYGYDGRGNVTALTHVAKSGSGLANIVVSATYPATCANPLTCNLPTSTTDARGGVTNYAYDSTHGGVLTVTAPAPTGGAARPQTRVTYASSYAWFKNSAGAIVQAPVPVTLPTAVSACATGTSCTNAANEVRATFVYGASGVANNLLVTQVTQRDGTGALSASTSFAYTPNGDVASVDGPLAGTDDTTHYRYDAARQLIGVIGPDPDGGGALRRRAVRTSYNLNGQITLAEQGTVTGTSDPAWAAFSPLQQVVTAYDSHARPTHARVQSGATTYALQQTSYDSMGRVDCVTTRMNPASFASPPSSACTLATTGSFGPDRIVRYGYDAASQVTSVISGYASGAAITQAFSYTNNGQLATAQDGNGNLSTWVYDGFDRVSRLRFPNATGGGSSAADYVEYTYDAASNVTGFRSRAGQSFASTYDALNRLIALDAPGSMPDTSYTYDNLNRPTGASQSGHAQTFAWDALSRLTSQTGPLGTFAFQYDLASRRTRITWPDAYYAQYDWSLYDEVTAVRENGASSGVGVLATYAYDNLGQRTTVARGNGVGTTYGYDSISRLTSIAHNLTGTSQDVTFTLGYNPAGQIISRTISNDAYVFGVANQNTSYSNNGRNELVTAGASSFTYDSNRNLTNDGTRAYAYDAANQLTSAGSTSFSYDPTGALYDVGAHRLASVGGERLALYTTSGGALHRRIVPGAGLDEAAAYYHGSGTGTRQWPLADQLGSVIAYANASGATANINTYDEYGRPGSGNAEFLQYTGQLAIASAPGVYNYRNRFYQADIGRFLQTDPIGYIAGLNLYAYVGNDPMNWIDPWGLQEDEIVVPGDRCAASNVLCDQRDIDYFLFRDLLLMPTGIDESILGPLKLKPAAEDEVLVTATRQGWARFQYRLAARQGFNALWRLQTHFWAEGARLAGPTAGAMALYDCLSGAGCDPLGVVPFARITRVCGCFEEGTLVATPEGLRRIEEIEVGDSVLAWDEATGETSSQRVTALIRPEPKVLWRLEVRDADGEAEIFHVTDDHPWYVEGQGWIETQHLQAGQRIETADDRGLDVVDIAATDRVDRTYNLTVEGLHTFLVGEGGAVVHNDPCTWLIDVTRRTRIPNFQINTTRAQFAANLRANGWTATALSNGAVRYTNPSSGVTYVIRGAASTPIGGAIDVLNSSGQRVRVYRPGG